MRYSLFFQTQFPLNTCPFWWTSSCGFYARQLALAPPGDVAPAPNAPAADGGDPASRGSSGNADSTPPLPAAAKDTRASPLFASVDVSLVSLGLGPARPRELSSTSTQAYQTSSCTTYSTWNYMVYIVWNTFNADDVAAKETLLTQFASLSGATRNNVNCGTYARTPTGANSTILMCSEVTTPSSTSWFASPYGYAAIYVPSSYVTWATTWLMRNHDATNLNSYASYSLPFFVTPLSGCTFYDFEFWSVRSDNNTALFNYYPMTSPAAAFGSAAVGGVAGERITLTSTSCTMTGWNL